MVEDESSRTILGMLRLREMIVLVGCSCNPPASYLPQVVVRVGTVSILALLRYLRVHLSVILRLLDTLYIGGVGASDSRGSGHLLHECHCVVPRPRYHIRI